MRNAHNKITKPFFFLTTTKEMLIKNINKYYNDM